MASKLRNLAAQAMSASHSAATNSDSHDGVSDSKSMGGTPLQQANPFTSLQSGYNLAVYIVKHVLGFDPGFLVNLSIAVAGLSTAGRYLSHYFSRYIRRFFVASAQIHEDEVILYHDLQRFISEKFLKDGVFQDVKASTYGYMQLAGETTPKASKAAQRLDSDDDSEIEDIDSDFQANHTTLSRRKSRTPVKFSPYELSKYFYYKGNIFYFSHGLRSTFSGHPLVPQRQNGELTLQCLGRSLDPIRRLIDEAQEYCENLATKTTNIYRASNGAWTPIGRRPSRAMSTVILEKRKKRALLKDIHDYLRSATKRWYSDHGIPYRRGYLFSGPPGTGKTSLTAALAGVFGLDIYVLSLLDPMNNEDTLARLFSCVGHRSIVLLEDIDAAGLTSKRTGAKKRGHRHLNNSIAPVLAPVPPQPMPIIHPPMPPMPPGISRGSSPGSPYANTTVSLSGLLNAIDGVSSSEGHILIMTTNKPEDLDPALTRPGRVDLHVRFTLPKREEVIEMFVSMYRDLPIRKRVVEASGVDLSLPADEPAVQEKHSASEAEATAPSKRDSRLSVPLTERFPTSEESTSGPSRKADAEAAGPSTPRRRPLPPPTTSELRSLAEQFASVLPENKLSLAAIQGFLLIHKLDPRKAASSVGAWWEEEVRREREEEEGAETEAEEAEAELRAEGGEHEGEVSIENNLAGNEGGKGGEAIAGRPSE